jgi:hypothetical protein
LGAQGIHRLGTRDARDIFHSEGGELSITTKRDIAGALGVREKRDRRRPGGQWSQAGGIEGLHTEHDVRLIKRVLRD